MPPSCAGDIGWLDSESLRELLGACSPKELTAIEDGTKCVMPHTRRSLPPCLQPSPLSGGSHPNATSRLCGTAGMSHHRVGSGRDLSYYSWHFWHAHYLQAYGPPPSDSLPPSLPGAPPEDYLPPPIAAPEGARPLPAPQHVGTAVAMRCGACVC